ncbi:MAG: sugar ABC transporter ATP-binding protein [Candidatus Actinomarinales bacterium]|nr:MAG: sugar ABC transporter ATP-binding protein [Candidatus Actinomarinales bacterium]
MTIKINNISKSFGNVVALNDVSLTLNSSEVLGLLGDNGAGKSTLIKILSGIHENDSGEILFDGNQVSIEDPRKAQSLGVATVYQDLSLVELRNVSQNIFLGLEPRVGRFFVNRQRMDSDAKELLDRLQINIPNVRSQVQNLSGGQRQSVAIARAIARGGDTILLDEPTAALGVEQTAQVHGLLKELKDAGKTVVVISHDIKEVLNIVDRVVVLRQGAVAGEGYSKDLDQGNVVDWITGVER